VLPAHGGPRLRLRAGTLRVTMAPTTMSLSPLADDSHLPAYAADPAAIAARDRLWVAGIRASDAAAFEAMFRAYKNDLVGFVESVLRSHEAAQEVVQDLFLRIWQQRELWEFPGPLNTYLFRAARNRAISQLRHERIEARFRERVSPGQTARLHGSPAPADERARTADLRAAIERAVNDLPDRCREVFRLSRYHHLGNAEVAQVLEISVNTVEVQMTRAIGFLRKRLADFQD
jgi:RNA polymerase sigma-70 factor (ECF subfamily)